MEYEVKNKSLEKEKVGLRKIQDCGQQIILSLTISRNNKVTQNL
jgi:hypothetical protein